MLEKGTDLFKFEQELFLLKKKWSDSVDSENLDQAKEEVYNLLGKYDKEDKNRAYAFFMADGFYQYLDFKVRHKGEFEC